MIDYVSLHNHSSFSLMRSILKPKDLFQRCKDLGQKAVAVTDHASMAGMWDCLKAARSVGIKFIPGCEFNFVDDVEDESAPLRTIVLLARNAKGYENLLTLGRRGFDNYIVAFKKAVPRIDWSHLEEYNEGLICITGDGNGIIAQSIMQKDFNDARKRIIRLNKLFGEYFALELQPHDLHRKKSPHSGTVDQRFINKKLKELGQELNIKCVVASDSHYLNKDQHRAHDVLLAIGSGQPINSGNRLTFNVDEFYVKSAPEVAYYFIRKQKHYDPEFIKSLFDNSVWLAEQCEFPDWIDPKYSNPSGKELPEFPVKDQPDYKEFLSWVKENYADSELDEDKLYLRYRCELGFKEKVPKGKEYIYRERLNEELEVMEYKGFSSYMLIVMDYIEFARKNGVPCGPARGSVASCLSGYLVNIHIIDPIKYNLIFARFLNKHRQEFPDVDQDLGTAGRNKVIDYVRQKYGPEYVAHVSNVNAMTPKVYVRDIARTFNFGDQGRSRAAEIGDAIADSIPASVKSIKQALEECPLFIEFTKVYPELAEFSDTVAGAARAWSTHAAGVIVGKRKLTGLVPLRRDKDGIVALEYDKERAEANGLVKMDFLGLSTLDIIENTYKIIKNVGKPLPPKPIDFYEYDKKTYDLISSGDTFGVFQLTGVAAPVCRMVQPKNIEDISLVTALIRPAAKDIIKDFMEVRSGNKEMELLHPNLKRALGLTCGFGLFEECLMYIASDIAGWNLHKADDLRKMTKNKGKYPEKVEELKNSFINDAPKNKNVSTDIATKIWEEIIAGFGGYGFNLCLTADTLVYRPGANHHQPNPEITIGELFEAQESDTHWGNKIRRKKLGLLQFDNDGRIRPKKMKKIHYNGRTKVYFVRTKSGRGIRATENHRFLSTNGYIAVKDIEPGHTELICMGEEKREKKVRETKRARGKSYDGCGMPKGSENPSWLDGRTTFLNKAKIGVAKRAKNKCEFCDKSISNDKHAGEFAHIDSLENLGGDYFKYHSVKNIKLLCNNCHKKFDYDKGERKPRWSKGRPSETDLVISVEYDGVEDVYDVEMNSEEHNFIANEIVSHNSHATSYSVISYYTAYLKAHYPLEFLVANLMFEVNSNSPKAKDNVIKIKDEIRSKGIDIVSPDINKSELTYKILDDNTLMTGLDSMKWMGKDAMPEILDKRPFNSFEDFIAKVNGSKVKAPSVQALAASGALDTFGLPRKTIFLHAKDYKEKLKNHLKKDPEKRGEFKYPFPKEKEWTPREKFALEVKYLGEGFSGSINERYEGFFNKNSFPYENLKDIFPYVKQSDDPKIDRKENSFYISGGKSLSSLKGVIFDIWSFTVKKEDSTIFGQDMARITVQDPWGNKLDLVAFPDCWSAITERAKKLGLKDKFEPGVAVEFNGVFQYDSENNYSMILNDILDIKEKPQLPEDLKARKVKMPKATKTKSTKGKKKEEIAEQLESEFVDDGIDSLFDDEDDEVLDPFN